MCSVVVSVLVGLAFRSPVHRMPISRYILDLAYDPSKRDQIACVANSKKNHISTRCFPFRVFRALGRSAATRFSISSGDRSSSKTVAGRKRKTKKPQEPDRAKDQKEKKKVSPKEKAQPKKTGQTKKKPQAKAKKTDPTKKKPLAKKTGVTKKKTDQKIAKKKTAAAKKVPGEKKGNPVPVARKSPRTPKPKKKTNLN